MTTHPLDNPVWSSLTTRHASLAVMQEPAGRYPPQMAPFVAVGTRRRAADRAARSARQQRRVRLLRRCRAGVRAGLERRGHTCDSAARVHVAGDRAARPEPVVLTERHRSDMLALTALVFPGFFRARTVEMGRYIGIYHGRVLAAMAGERMRIDGYQEISGVCTHPEFIGRGYAQRLVALLTNSVLERGVTPFLHVHRDNARALSLYEHLGYRQRRELGLWSVTRNRPL